MYILFDIGGTKTRVAVSSDLKSLDKVESFKPHQCLLMESKRLLKS